MRILLLVSLLTLTLVLPARGAARAADPGAPPPPAAPAEATGAQTVPAEALPAPEARPPDAVPAGGIGESAAADEGPVLPLEEVLNLAESRSLDLVVMRERLEQADVQVRRAWAAMLPNLSTSASYTRNSTAAKLMFPDFAAGFQQLPLPTGDVALIPNALLEIEIQPQDQWSAMGQVTQPILVMPAFYAIASVRQGAQAAELALTHARNELFFGISQAYYGAVASKRFIELAQKQLATAKEQERISKARYELGELPKMAFLRAGVDRARAEQDLRRAENGHASAKLALQTLAGIEGRFTVVAPPPVAPPTGSEEELVRTGLQKRKDLASSRAAAEIADRMVKTVWWKFAPMLLGNGMYRWSNSKGFTGENTSWMVTLTASLTLYDGGNRYAELDDARSKAREAEATRENLRRKVVEEVRRSLLELESAQANLVKAREQAKLADENAILARKVFDAGAASYLDVVDASSAQFGASVAAVSEELNVEIASLKLAKAIGQFGAEHLNAVP